MSSLRSMDRLPFEELLEMSGGYVLDFTDASFGRFIRDAVGRNIHDERYSKNGFSKAKKLRVFWEIEPDPIVAKLLYELIEYWSYRNPTPTVQQQARVQKCREIVQRLDGSQRQASEMNEAEFLRIKFVDAPFEKLRIESNLIPILKVRFEEAQKSLKAEAPLAAIFLCGSILEGILLGVAMENLKEFNQAGCTPRDDNGKPKQVHHWSLAQLIDVACEVGYLRLDVKKFSHELRDFRNYIHPFQQMRSRFDPDKHTAEICMQVLRAAIACLSENRGKS